MYHCGLEFTSIIHVVHRNLTVLKEMVALHLPTKQESGKEVIVSSS